LRTVADYLKIDQALLSRYETSERSPHKEIVIKLARYFKTNEKKLVTVWLSDKLLDTVKNEDLALDAMKVAEARVAYQKKQKR